MRRICLDLGESNPIGQKYIQAIIEQRFDDFQFENCLSYVSLPPRKHTKTKLEAPDTLDTYREIFDFLRKQNVEKIFKIIVNDLVGPPHSDRSIVELTKEFHVEHWEWRKLDISSDAILRAAPEVKSVVLHSSGNFSVLQGWACKHGQAKLQDVSFHLYRKNPIQLADELFTIAEES